MQVFSASVDDLSDDAHWYFNSFSYINWIPKGENDISPNRKLYLNTRKQMPTF